MSTPTRFTHSSIGTLRTCPRKYWIEYEQKVRPDREAEPLRIGSAYHDAREMDDDDLEVGLARIADRYSNPPAWCETEEQHQAWAAECVVVLEMYRGYRTHAIKPFEVIASELEFSIPIPGLKKVRNAGKVDKLVKLDDGRLAVLEIKTCGEDIDPTSDYWHRLRMDAQITRYYSAARHMGFDAQTIVYDVTRKPTTRPKNIPKASIEEIVETATYHGFHIDPMDRLIVRQERDRHLEAEGDIPKSKRKVPKIRETPGLFAVRLREMIDADPTRYYQSIEIPRTTRDLEVFDEKMLDDVAEIRFRRSKGVWQKNDRACNAMGRCPYLDICANHIDIEHETPDGFVRISTPHPELEAKQ